VANKAGAGQLSSGQQSHLGSPDWPRLHLERIDQLTDAIGELSARIEDEICPGTLPPHFTFRVSSGRAKRDVRRVRGEIPLRSTTPGCASADGRGRRRVTGEAGVAAGGCADGMRVRGGGGRAEASGIGVTLGMMGRWR
jgi:hypothetical protein